LLNYVVLDIVGKKIIFPKDLDVKYERSNHRILQFFI
jgi:hypothetical protein